jgi:isochorismate pyruvate lyase
MDLAKLRLEIDSIDEQLCRLLERRFRTVDAVIATKQRNLLPARIDTRVEEVIQNAKDHAAKLNVPVEGIERIWRQLVNETIRYEESQGVKKV